MCVCMCVWCACAGRRATLQQWQPDSPSQAGRNVREDAAVPKSVFKDVVLELRFLLLVALVEHALPELRRGELRDAVPALLLSHCLEHL